jgi:hypothetical protein
MRDTAIDDVLRADNPGRDGLLSALARTAEARSDLDTAERRLIGLAREHGATWQEIAAVLGLRSRQAAEQRWLRLSGTLSSAAGRDPGEARRERGRQRTADNAAGAEVVTLRAAVQALFDRMGSGRSLALPRRTLQHAVHATPGALYDLAKLAVNDLSGESARALDRPAAQALERVRELLGPTPRG